MNLLEYIREAFGALIKNKMRSLLSLLGIVIGITSVVVLTAIGDGFKENMMKSFSSTNTMITIARGNSRYEAMEQKRDPKKAIGDAAVKSKAESIFTQDTLSSLRKILWDQVKYILPKLEFSTPSISWNTKSLYGSVVPVELAFFRARKLVIERGMAFSSGQIERAERVAVIGQNLVTQNFKDTDPIGEPLMIGNQLFRVIGILKKVWDFETDGNIYIPASTARERYGARRIENIQVYVESIKDMPQASSNIGYYLMKSVGSNDPKNSGFHIETNDQFLAEMKKSIGNTTMMISGIAAISLIVGGIGIMNIMLVSVTERTREIGIRKAIGARRRDIVIQFLTESAVLSFLGGIFAIILSYMISFVIANFVPTLSPIITIQTIILATTFSILMGIVFGLMPAWKAAKMEPIDALRFE